MHWGTFVLSLSVPKGAHFLHQQGQLSFHIELVLVVDLQANILDGIALEGDQVLLAGEEQRQRDFEQDVLDVRLDQLSRVLEPHAHGKELDGQGKGSRANELGFSEQEKIKVNLVESGDVVVLELLHE